VNKVFSLGDRVVIAEDFYWAKGTLGTVSDPPPEVISISGPWNGLTRSQTTALDRETVYWVWFDEPQRDADGDRPYRGGSIDVNALSLLPKKSN
jgi:hypothetical protein